MISKTQVKKRIKRKTAPTLVETIRLANNNKAWNEIAKILSGSTSQFSSVNVDEIEKKAADNDKIVVPGKVLGVGEITKKITIAALSFSETAKEKLSKTKIQTKTLLEEIKENPEAKGVKIIK